MENLKLIESLKNRLPLLAVVFFYLFPVLAFAQDSNLETQVQSWQVTTARIAKAVVGLAAIAGGVFVYFKMNLDEGERGKKALISFIGALIFAVLMFYLIDFFLGTNIGDQTS